MFTLLRDRPHGHQFSKLCEVLTGTPHVTPVLPAVVSQGQAACQGAGLTLVAGVGKGRSGCQGRGHNVRGVQVPSPAGVGLMSFFVFPNPVDLLDTAKVTANMISDTINTVKYSISTTVAATAAVVVAATTIATATTISISIISNITNNNYTDDLPLNQPITHHMIDTSPVCHTQLMNLPMTLHSPLLLI